MTLHLGPGRTAALVGSSGVGKSTLLNRIAGAELQRVRAARASDGRGTHTTSGGRLVTVVFAIRGRLIRVISARDMSRPERRRYEQKNEEAG